MGNNPVCYEDPSGYGGRPVPVRSPDPLIDYIMEETTRRFVNRGEVLGAVSSQRNFNEWFDHLSVKALEKLMNDRKKKNDGRTTQAAFDAITDRLGGKGEMHEWLPVSQAVIAKKWGVTAKQIKEWTTPTETTYFVNIEVDGELKSGFHGTDGSTTAHNELIRYMKESESLEQYKVKLNDWADRHLVLATKDGKGNIKKELARGRTALPKELQLLNVPGLPDKSIENSHMDVSPKNECNG